MSKRKDIRPTFKMNLEVTLTEEELKQTAKTLASSLNHQKKIQGELESFKAQKKAELSMAQDTVERCTLLLNTGREFRMVLCEWDYNWIEGKRTAYRKDTGEAVGVQEISDEERQLRIDEYATSETVPPETE